MSDAIDPREAPESWGEAHERTTTWWPPAASFEARAGLTGMQYLQGMRDGTFAPPPIITTVGAEVVSFSEGEVHVRCAPDPAFLNPLGLVHGGLLCTLLDTAMGIAVQTTVDASVGYATIELKVSYLGPLPADGRSVDVHGRALKVGRRIAFAEAHAYAADGTLLGHGTSSLSALRIPAG